METLTLNPISSIGQWRSTLRTILASYADFMNFDGDIRVYVLVSEDQNHFMLMHEGWQGHERLYGAIVHTEIREDKIWIHFDGMEDGIAIDLLAAGISKENIVLAFHPIGVREFTGFAIGRIKNSI